jgi:hypothetical protein
VAQVRTIRVHQQDRDLSQGDNLLDAKGDRPKQVRQRLADRDRFEQAGGASLEQIRVLWIGHWSVTPGVLPANVGAGAATWRSLLADGPA